MCVSQPGGVRKSRTSGDDKKHPVWKREREKKKKNCVWPLSQLGSFHSLCLHKQGPQRFIALLQSFSELFNGELTDLRAAVCFLPLQSILNRLDVSYVLYIQRLPIIQQVHRSQGWFSYLVMYAVCLWWVLFLLFIHTYVVAQNLIILE